MLQSQEEQCAFGRKLKQFKMADITGVLSSSHFHLTNITVLSLPFNEYPFSLPSHAGNTFLIGFMFYQCLLGVVTHKKYDEMRVLLFPFLARPSQDPATWLVKLLLQL